MWCMRIEQQTYADDFNVDATKVEDYVIRSLLSTTLMRSTVFSVRPIQTIIHSA